MMVSIDQVDRLTDDFADHVFSVLRFFQGSHNWRRNWGRRKQLNDVKQGGPDRLDHSGYPKGGPKLLVRPILVTVLRLAPQCTR